MSESMKAPRDILVAGIGFLLGMVLCYFLTTSKREPKLGTMAMNNQVQLAPGSLSAPAEEIISGANIWRVDLNTWPTSLLPNGYQKPVRIEPLYGPVAPPDLIDFNYVPDFEIDLK